MKRRRQRGKDVEKRKVWNCMNVKLHLQDKHSFKHSYEFPALLVEHDKYWFTGVETSSDTNHIHYKPFPARLVFTFPLGEVWRKTSASLSTFFLLPTGELTWVYLNKWSQERKQLKNTNCTVGQTERPRTNIQCVESKSSHS